LDKMVKCPNCKEEKFIQYLGILEIVDQVDEDEEYNYYVAVYACRCTACGVEFEVEEDYKERKKNE